VAGFAGLKHNVELRSGAPDAILEHIVARAIDGRRAVLRGELTDFAVLPIESPEGLLE
jgi:hypothetical protein